MEVGAKGYLRGNEVIWDGERWRLSDGTMPYALVCPRCCERMLPGDRDACLNEIDGAAGACCGHGVHLGYVNWEGIGVGPEWQAGAYVGR